MDTSYKKIPALAAYIDRVGAEQLNFKRFMVKDYKGHYYTERAMIVIKEDFTIFCSNKNYAPTKEEAEAIKHEMAKHDFPKAIKVRDIKALVKMLKEEKEISSEDELFTFIDRHDGQIIMVQQLKRLPDGRKIYPPWSFWSDGEWRRMEPGGLLPFWKPAKQRKTKVMLHEGAKVSRYLETELSKKGHGELANHPWLTILLEFEHWGMIGGALSPHRADYAELRREKPTEVVYVCDNDWPGQAALQEVSKAYGYSLKGIRFDERWPQSWDLADPMPEAFFKSGRYLGPALEELLVPATRATEIVPNPEGKGRPATRLLRDFREEWFHCVKPEVFVHGGWPNRIFTAQEFNNFVAPFSDVLETANLLKKDGASKSAVLKYSPAMEPGIYGSGDDGRFINTHVPAPIKAEKGNAAPWVEFMEHLVPDEGDRKELIRWCATLICRPDIKMLYGVLLISEIQGMGKGTLGEKILAPLVGETNVSYPSEQEIVDSNYNYWLAHKRLAVVHEIYAGHSSKAYNKLKSIITDKNVNVSMKYMANYTVENWIHVFACSNSMRALQLASDDRRWFVPKISEVKKPRQFWLDFNHWLKEQGGLGIIKWWMERWLEKNEPVLPGTDAPWSVLKGEIVEEGYSPGMKLVADTLDYIKGVLNGDDPKKKAEWEGAGYLRDGSIFVLDTALVELIRQAIYEGRHNDRLERPATIRRVAKSKGWFIGETRSSVKEWINSTKAAMGGRVIANTRELAITRPGDLCNETMSEKDKRRPLDVAQFMRM